MASQSTGFWQELRRREVLKTLILYAALGFALLEGISFVAENVGLPGAATLNRLLSLGYLLGFPACAFLAWSFDITRAGIREESPSSIKLGVGITAALGFVLAGSTALHLLLPLPVQPSRPAPATIDTLPNSVVVLPFDNMSGDAEGDFFSDGVAEEILMSLSQFSQLNVIGRRTSFALKSSRQSAADIAALLGVRFLLQGGVRQAGNRVRVSAQLVDASGVEVWSNVYERELGDVFALQEEIANTVASSVVPAIAPTRDSGYVPGLEAYKHYQRGRHLLYMRTVHKAIEELRKAVALDPDFADAWAELAISLLFYADSFAEEDVFPAAQRSIDRAMALAPDLPRAILAQAFLYLRRPDPDPAAAEPLLRRAVALTPNDGDASHWLAIALEYQRQHAEAFVARDRGLRLDPLHPALSAAVAGQALEQGDRQRAETILLRMTSVPNPSHYAYNSLRDLYVNSCQLVKLHRVAREEALQPYDIGYFSLAQVYGLIGDWESSRYWLDRSQGDVLRDNHIALPYFGALLPDWRGDFADAAAMIEAAVARERTTLERLAPFLVEWFGSVQALAGRFREAVTTLELLAPFDQHDKHDIRTTRFQDAMTGLFWAYRQLGESARAAEFHREIKEFFDSQREGASLQSNEIYFLATLAVVAGDTEHALEQLQQAIDKGWCQYYRGHHDPRWSVLHDNPRYRGMMAQVKANVDRQAIAIRTADRNGDFIATLDAVVRARQQGLYQ